MNEIAAHAEKQLSQLEGLAVQARLYAENATMSMLQLGRVFTEAKPLVKHGEWENWVRNNSGMSERQAQTLMQAYRRFGDSAQFRSLEKSKLFKMLALPKGTEDQFVEENDVSAMTSREVEEAVKRVRAQADAELERERAARRSAEERADRLSERPPEIPRDIDQALRDKDALIERQQRELDRVSTAGREIMDEANRLRCDNDRLRRELDENNELLEETQQECNRAQAELLNMQSTLAKGDAERIPCDELSSDAFAAAVRQFIGTCARMPHMGRTFAVMQASERDAYDELLRTVEGWARDARRALDSIAGKEIVVHD